MQYAPVVASALSLCSIAAAQLVNIEFDAGVARWRTVLDGVMGGRSTGRVTQPQAGVLRFSGELSLENNGGFSQMQTTVPGGSLKGAAGIEARVLGDGRTYQFDVRCSDVRLMAGSFQTEFDTVAGEWMTLRLPFEQFRLYSFGRLVPNAPKLTPARVESIGVTLADKEAGAFQLDVDFIRAMSSEAQAPATGSDLPSVAKSAELTTFLSLVEASGLQLPADVCVIDRVMMPETRSIAEIVSQEPRLATLRKAVTAAGLATQLGGENGGPWTLLAPSNEAFDALGEQAITSLLADPSQLANVLSAHVIPSRIRRGDMIAQRSARTLLGRDTVSFSLVDGTIAVAGAGIITADIEASNGVIHIIDRVIVPGPSAAGDMPAQVSKVVSGLLELAIERGVPIFNDGNPEACAAIYEVAITALIDLAYESVGSHAVERLRLALAEGQSEKDATERAWIFRRAMDRVYLHAQDAQDAQDATSQRSR